jgi:hypothetical protein
MEDQNGPIVSIDEKKSLELRKLRLEISDLERPWWQRPTYILAALPTMLAFGTLCVGIFTGFFHAQYTKMENQRHDLEAQIKVFEANRFNLNSQNEQLRQQNQQLTAQNDQLKKSIEGKEAAFTRITGLTTNLVELVSTANVSAELVESGKIPATGKDLF